MNLSGKAVGALATFYKILPDEILVAHDELDMDPGTVKLKKGGGHAGHNGLRSITNHIGAEFWRLRVGIGHPGDKRLVSNYVLADFTKADQDWIDDLLRGLEKNLDHLAAADGAKLMQGLVPVSQARPKTDNKPQKAATEAPVDTRSPLQKLMDKFSK